MPKRLLLGLGALVACVMVASASGATSTGFTTQVSPSDQTNATEPYIAIDRADGTIYVAWQASGSHVARSDDGGRTFQQKPELDPFGRDMGDVDIAVGGRTPCTADTPAVVVGGVLVSGGARREATVST
jgi:hypothetical protein